MFDIKLITDIVNSIKENRRNIVYTMNLDELKNLCMLVKDVKSEIDSCTKTELEDAQYKEIVEANLNIDPFNDVDISKTMEIEDLQHLIRILENLFNGLVNLI